MSLEAHAIEVDERVAVGDRHGVTPAVEHAIGTWLCCVAAAMWTLWMTQCHPASTSSFSA